MIKQFFQSFFSKLCCLFFASSLLHVNAIIKHTTIQIIQATFPFNGTAPATSSFVSVIAGLFVVMLVFNLATGRFVLGFDTPGVIAHYEHLWNILGMYTVGFAAVLAGGCPLLQLILARPRL